MLKNLLVNLPTTGTDNTAAEYATSLAREFDAHLAAIVFAYEAAPITMSAGDISPELIDELYREAERLAKGAVAKFEEAIRGSGVSSDVRWMPASFAGTRELFGHIARL
jgi:hypothetical protein